MTAAYVASFKIFVRCCDCLSNGSVRLDIPDVEDAPTSVDELTESAALGSVRFTCAKCEGTIGDIFGINQLDREAA